MTTAVWAPSTHATWGTPGTAPHLQQASLRKLRRVAWPSLPETVLTGTRSGRRWPGEHQGDRRPRFPSAIPDPTGEPEGEGAGEAAPQGSLQGRAQGGAHPRIMKCSAASEVVETRALKTFGQDWGPSASPSPKI